MEASGLCSSTVEATVENQAEFRATSSTLQIGARTGGCKGIEGNSPSRSCHSWPREEGWTLGMLREAYFPVKQATGGASW